MTKPKRLMLLGGIRYLLPVIKAAREQGCQVITADYVPGNIAHRYSDEYVNVNIVDKEAVLAAAREKRIDGILSFGVDPGVVSTAYVQEQMGLPACGPYASVEILQNKDKFRKFLADNGFNVPKAWTFSSLEEALSGLSGIGYPVIVKPTDSAGSKGVTRVDRREVLEPALAHAFKHSIKGHVIVEAFIEKIGCSSDTDGFSVDGRLVFIDFNAQWFDAGASNPYTPAAYSWPSTFTKEQQDYLAAEIQRLITLLGMKTGVYNIETRIGTDGKPYIMELTPRGGGNRLCEMIRYATGVDLITAATRAAVGDSIPEIEQRPYEGHWAEIILHAQDDGIFDGIEIDPSLRAELIERDLWVEKGDRVEAFNGASNAIGTLVLRFNTAEALEQAVKHPDEWLTVKVRP